MSILEEQLYEKKINFFKNRLQTCGYRFYNIIQTRRKEVPRLLLHENNEILQQEVETKVLGAADQFINCLRGEHYSPEIPEYLASEAQQFKTLVYTRLAPKFVLEEKRSILLEKIFAVEHQPK